MLHQSVIYRLKQNHGRRCIYIKHGETTVDPATGVQDCPETRFDLGRVIVLPVRLVLTSVATHRTKDHPSGSFYNCQDTIALIPRAELPRLLQLAEGDELILLPQDQRVGVEQHQLEDERFAVKGILDMHGEYFIELGLGRIAFDNRGER